MIHEVAESGAEDDCCLGHICHLRTQEVGSLFDFSSMIIIRLKSSEEC